MNTLHHKTRAVSGCLGLLLVVGLVLAPTPARAGHIGEREVRAAVETWVRYVTADARPDATVERMEPYQVDGETVAYIAHLKGGGFCIAGADDLLLPVYLYSPVGTYDPRHPAYQYVLEEIATRFKTVRSNLAEQNGLQPSREALAERAAYWQTLIAGHVPATASGPMAPLAAPTMMKLALTSHWHQGSPYNDQTPELTPGADEHTVVGCVATALAQIMYYWKWPNVGVGTGSTVYYYRWWNTWDEESLADDPGIVAGWTGRLDYNNTTRRLRINGYWDQTLKDGAAASALSLPSPNFTSTLTTLWNRMPQANTTTYANFGATTYNWSILADRHTDPPDAGAQEAAKLSSHAGIAVTMAYWIWVSYSNGDGALDAYKNHFRYDLDVKNDHTNTATMITELQWLRPLQMYGTDSRGGHSWVAFGYNTAVNPGPQFWMNWGWDDGSDSWYTWDQWFSTDQWHTSWIAPVNVKFVGAAIPGDGSPADPYQNVEAAIASAPDGSTLIFQAGSVNTFSTSPLVINRPLTLKGWDVTITR